MTKRFVLSVLSILKNSKITMIFNNSICTLHTKFQKLSFSNAILLCKNDIWWELYLFLGKKWEKGVWSLYSPNLENERVTRVFNRNWSALKYYYRKSTFDMIFTQLFIAKDEKSFVLSILKNSKITLIFNNNQCTLHTRFQK